jgi:hypothetical protein
MLEKPESDNRLAAREEGKLHAIQDTLGIARCVPSSAKGEPSLTHLEPSFAALSARRTTSYA